MKRLAIIVPFRKRWQHLYEFVPHYSRRFFGVRIFVIEQGDNDLFNRAKLLNIGFLEFQNEFDYCIFHDVDLLLTKGNYDYSPNPTQLATHAQQFRYKMPFPEYFGGATMFTKEDFIRVNGFSNNFKGHGGEDNEMFYNVLNHGLTIEYRDCFYQSLYHPKSAENPTGFDPDKMAQAKLPRKPDDGITHCGYSVLEKKEFPLYTHLKVEL